MSQEIRAAEQGTGRLKLLDCHTHSPETGCQAIRSLTYTEWRLLQKSTVSQSCWQDCPDFAERMKRKALRVRSEGSIPPYVTEAESRKQHSDSPLCNSRLLFGVDRCESNGPEAQLTRSKVSTAHPYYGLLVRALGRLVMGLTESSCWAGYGASLRR